MNPGAREETGPLQQRGPYSVADVFWLVRLRWYAIAGVATTVALCLWLRLIDTGPAVVPIVATMALVNLALWAVFRARLKEVRQGSLEGAIMPQLVLDLVALSLLLHLAGGVENPFVAFFAFHMAIGAMFLRPKLAWMVGLAGGVFHVSLVLAEFLAVLPHHHLAFAFGAGPHPDLHRMPAFVGGYLGAFMMMLGGVIYFVQTVAERTRHTEALRQQHERVARSRERLARVGEISASVAHAIRNPLHGLINCAAILRCKTDQADASVAETHELLEEGLQRIDRITHRLLVLSRDAPLQRLPTDLGALLHDAIRFVEGRARQRQVHLAVESSPVPSLLLDADRFGEVLINVLDNALDASPPGGTIVLSAGLVPRSRHVASIAVSDDGAGIPPEHIDKIFDPFFTTKAVGEGSGLGLAIAREVVEQHGGEIRLESRSGRGTTVRMLLPSDTAGSTRARGPCHERQIARAGGRR